MPSRIAAALRLSPSLPSSPPLKPLSPSPPLEAFASLVFPPAVKPSPLFVYVVYSVPCRRTLDTQMSVREVAELYGSEKSFVVEVHRALSRLHSTALIAKLRRRRQELTQATPDQSVDDEAVYFNVAGECPKGRVYGLGSLGRKKRIYADPGASTSQLSEMVPRSEFDSVAEQLRQVVAFMQRQFGMTMDGAGLSQPPLPPPPHEQQHPPQIDPADPPQQQDNVDREMQD
ncbi:hypothetical protein Scep_016602 [Stephania cephalantha]|uniref:Uncharacterized protein n=1 Tax=Stephania cephalantha TaxID=152367 RepID=A0AAP0NUB5_9MAGN